MMEVVVKVLVIVAVVLLKVAAVVATVEVGIMVVVLSTVTGKVCVAVGADATFVEENEFVSIVESVF